MSMNKESEVMESELSKTDMCHVLSVSQQKGTLKTRVTSYHDVLDTAGCLECRRVSWSQAAGGLGKVLCSGKQVSDLVG